jgi:pimeloyl-ACP methyl ester carboxylesterase
MQSHWIHKAHVIGHSMGAKAAMQFAINHEDYVDKLIAIDMGPKKYDSRHYTIFNTLLSIPVRKMDNRQEVEEMLHQEIPQAAVRQFLMKNLSRKKKGGFKWKMNLKILYKHYEEILAEINGEKTYEGQSLFIRGGMSDYVLDADFEFIQNIFPNGKIKTIPEAGHWVHVDARDRLIEMIRQFIAA